MHIDEDRIFYSRPQDIIIRDDLPRYRKDAVKVKSLLESIQSKGQLHPIVVTEDMVLIAGGRRLAACILGDINVRCTFKANLSALEIREIELEENLQREDLSPADEADAIADLHELKQEIYGESTSGKEGGWKLSDTADAIGKSKGHVIDNIQISKALEDFPELRTLKTKKAIKKAVKGCEMVAERAAAITVWEDVIEKEDTVEILHKDAVLDMTEIPDGSIDILLTDPKYGIEIDKIATSVGGTTGGISTSGYKYDDSPDDALRLYRLLTTESYRFTTENAHAYVFVAPEFFTPIRNMMIAAGWQAHIKPLIWIKRESGQCNMPEMWPSSCYEMILYCRKASSKLVVQGMPDWIQEDPVLESKRLHISEKPIPLLRKLLIRVALPGQRLYDPFMGSGSSLEAGLAQKLIVRGCDIDVNSYNAANKRVADYLKGSER
ncbi:MAG: ParB N-terminal domain-containing protein [Proteobacteria bacterium]|nr:ParB N-terminal domain-containing protein [Pseudomonadota bacterium]